MILHNSFSKKLACTALFLALPLSTAGAFEANAVADRFKAALAGQGTEITWSNLTENGSQIVLQDTKIKFPGVEAPTDAALIGDVTLDGVADENGGYKIGKVTLPAYRSTIEGLDIDMSGAEVSGLTLPPGVLRHPARRDHDLSRHHGREPLCRLFVDDRSRQGTVVRPKMF